MARTTSLTTSQREAILDGIDQGAGYETVSKAAGLGKNYVGNLIRASRNGEPISDELRAFAEEIEIRRNRWEIEALRKLQDLSAYELNAKAHAAATRALMWLLERKRRGEYGAQVTVKLEEMQTKFFEMADAYFDECLRANRPVEREGFFDFLERGGKAVQGEATAVH